MKSLVRVLKFGGTSVADCEAQARSANIVQLKQDEAHMVVVSAPAGVTNALVAICSNSDTQVADSNRSFIRNRVEALFDGLGRPESIQSKYSALLSELDSTTQAQGQQRDRQLSLGERFSSLLFTERLCQLGVRAQHYPASQLIATDDQYGHAEPDLAQTREQVKSALDAHNGTVLVTEGFIGADPSGNITTIGRGGSDYSASLLAEAGKVDVIEIWTDTVLRTCDPRLVPEAKPLEELSFSQAAELATFGANILHPKTLWPAIRSSIDVYIGSTLDPQGGGTFIRRHSHQSSLRHYAAVALRKNQTLVILTSLEMLHSIGYLSSVFGILAKHKISVDLVTTSEISIALTLDERGSQQVLSQVVLDELRQLGKVEVRSGLALVALVGADLTASKGVAAQVFQALGDINIQLVCHGASPHNLCFLVDDADGPLAIRRLHKQLFD